MMDGLSFALGEVTDFTGPWLVLGLLVAALCGEGLDPAWLRALEDSHLTVPAMAVVALPLYLCGSASTLIVAVLLAKGLSFGGALTFVWAASMLSPAAVSAMRRHYGRGPGTFVVARVGLGVMLAGALAQGSGLGQRLDVAQGPRQLLSHADSVVPLTAAAYALWVLLTWAIARQGVRRAVDQIAVLNRDGSPSHHHGGH